MLGEAGPAGVFHNPHAGAGPERPVLQGLRCLPRRAPKLVDYETPRREVPHRAPGIEDGAMASHPRLPWDGPSRGSARPWDRLLARLRKWEVART